jgi:hypothetical protein
MNPPSFLQRPILGGVFGSGQYSLVSMPIVSRGLHAVRYIVIEPAAGTVLSIAEDKLQALAAARRLLRASDVSERPEARQATLWRDDEFPALRDTAKPLRTVPRRRREIFDRSQGRCHYCAAALTLDGHWHVEHMLPRALGGSDGAYNLVASCARCNLTKRDRSALEFVMPTVEVSSDLEARKRA